MIPGAYEPDVPLHRDTPDAHPEWTAPAGEALARPAAVATSYVVDAPGRATTFLGHAAGVVRDLGLIAAVMFVAAAVPTLVVWGIYLAGVLILEAWGRQ